MIKWRNLLLCVLIVNSLAIGLSLPPLLYLYGRVVDCSLIVIYLLLLFAEITYTITLLDLLKVIECDIYD